MCVMGCRVIRLVTPRVWPVGVPSCLGDLTVVVEGTARRGCSRSSDYASNTGVVQGSRLGPLLFLAFIDDLIVPKSCHPDPLRAGCRDELRTSADDLPDGMSPGWTDRLSGGFPDGRPVRFGCKVFNFARCKLQSSLLDGIVIDLLKRYVVPVVVLVQGIVAHGVVAAH